MNILGEEKDYLLFKEILPEDGDYGWIVENAKELPWKELWKYIPWEYFRLTEPFNLYNNSNKKRTLDVFKDFTPMIVGREYIVSIVILYHYGIIYIFVPNGAESWYNKAIYDFQHEITRKVLFKQLRKEKSPFPFDKITTSQRKLTNDDIVYIRYGMHGIRLIELSRMFQVDHNIVSRIKSREYWKFI
jgi:hypothetical protein